MSQVASLVEKHISDNFIAVFSKSYCPYCHSAKQTLKDLDRNFSALELDLRDDGADIQNYLLQKTGQRTVPSIFIGQKHLGGNDSLQAAKANGSLTKLLEGTA